MARWMKVTQDRNGSSFNEQMKRWDRVFTIRKH
jgi:hypothetical protein